jgi:GNAT superfamily N-acetyltransferase
MAFSTIETVLRLAGPGDADAVRTLTRAAYAKWVPVIGREPMPMQADYAQAVRAHRIDLLYDGAQLKALIETILRPDHLFIENVAVAPDAQGRGFGRYLLAHAEQLARSRGVAELRLLTNKSFASNVQLYLRTGYAIDREEPFKGSITVYMSKRLPSP